MLGMSRYTLKEGFIQILLLIVIVHGMNPTIFAPSLHRLDADAKPLGDLLLGPISSDAQSLIPRWKLEAFAQFIAVCSASILAEALCISSPFSELIS